MSRTRPSQFRIGSSASALGSIPGWFRRLGHRAIASTRATHRNSNAILDAARVGVRSAVAPFGVESLESRTMLTTFTSVGASGSYVYYDGFGQNVYLSYNDVTFEAIGAFVDPTTQAVTLGNLVPGVFAPATEPTLGANIYKIYVTYSASDSYIAISTVNYDTASNQIHLTPYTAAIPAFPITNTGIDTADTKATVPAGTGGVLIGALNPGPVASVPIPAPIGLQPVPASGVITPGIEVAPTDPSTGLFNDSFGNFLVGGTVMGTVSFPGNVNEFYAGAVLTGDIGGGQISVESGVRPYAGNFSVGGDLREFLTDGPVGTDGKFVSDQGPLVPNYTTDFDLTVGGKLGEMHIGNTQVGPTNLAGFAGTVEVTNNQNISYQTPYAVSSPTNITGELGDQTEWEVLQHNSPDDLFADGDVQLRNDTPADAQLLGSIPELDPSTGLPVRDASGNIIYEASVDGVFQPYSGDNVDYYEIPVLAGSSFQVSLTSGSFQVIDPDGRVIASNSKSGATPVQITPDRPGLYLFAVNDPGDTTADNAYNLTITNIGELGIGGIIVNGDMSDIGIDTSIVCSNDDIGVIDVVGSYDSFTLGPTPTTPSAANPTVVPPLYAPDTIFVSNGNLRALIAGSLGTVTKTSTITTAQGTSTETDFEDGPTLDVPFGSVGLVRNTQTAGVLDLGTEFDPNYLDLTGPNGVSAAQHVTNDQYATAIGGDIQVIDAAGTFYGRLAVDGGIGTIHAATMGTDPASYIDVNADNKGDDGIIDLIDVAGEFGTLTSGGPEIVTNTGGQVRYMLIGGTIFRDEFFGGGFYQPVTYNVGQVATMTDDAGNVLVITPIGPISNTTTETVTTPATNSSGTATTVTTSVDTGPQITISAYAIRDKSGQVPIAITSTGSISIASNATATGSSQVNIGTLTIEGTGSPIEDTTLDPFQNNEIGLTPIATTAPVAPTDTTTAVNNANGSITTTTVTTTSGGTTTQLSALIAGSAKINILDFVGTGPGGVLTTAGYGDVTSFINNTNGEVASVTAANIGQILVHGNLGYTTPVATPAAVMPKAVITDGNTYPFVQQHTGVVLTGNTADTITTGNAVDIDAYGGIGNVIVTGTLENLVPNYAVSTGISTNPIPGQFSGINGPIYGGTFINVDVGQGILPTGTGLVGFSGLFASGTIGVVDNAGNPNGDIRGNIISSATTGTNVAIGQIALKNASIIDSRIISLAPVSVAPAVVDFSETDDLSPGLALNDFGQLPFANPYTYDFGSILVTGRGGIIGGDVEAENIGPVVVNKGGFGILESNFVSLLAGRIASITASGYGIRDTNVDDGGYVGPIIATGSGAPISVLNYPIDVRESDATTIDPYFNFAPIAKTDLNAALGTSAEFPNIANVTDTGVIEDCEINAQESFAGLQADKVRTAQPVFNPNATLPSPSIPNIPYIGVTFPMSIAVGGSVGFVRIFGVTDGLQITAGSLGSFSPGNDVSRVGISIAGKIRNLNIHGNFGQPVLDPGTGTYIPDSYISASGPSGIIQNLEVFGSLFGNVTATGEIVHMLVAGDVTGSITAQGTSTPLGLGVLHVTGAIKQGALSITGNVNAIIINGGLGIPSGTLTVNGNANSISVGADHHQTGSLLRLNLDVTGRLGSLSMYGAINGNVTTGGDLGKLTVQGDGINKNVITGAISVGGRLGTANIINGNISGSVTAGGSIGSFTISRGDLLAGGTVQSLIDTIRSFNITGGLSYGLFGSLIEPSGLRSNINVSGNIGDGTDAAAVTAGSGNVFHVSGSILANASVSTTFGLSQLLVDGNIASGATIIAHPLVKIRVKGSNQGTITQD